MTDIMKFESIKHDAAEEVFEDSEFNWFDQLDNTDLEGKRIERLPEDQWYSEWYDYFKEVRACLEADNEGCDDYDNLYIVEARFTE